MARCCGCAVLRKKAKQRKRSRGKRRRVDTAAVPEPETAAAASVHAPLPIPSPTRQLDVGEVCQSSLVSSEGEYFDCLSDVSEATLEKSPSLHRISSKQSASRRSPSPVHSSEPESEESHAGIVASLWDLLPWKLRQSSIHESTAGPSEPQSEAAELAEGGFSETSLTMNRKESHSNVLAACLPIKGPDRQPMAKSESQRKRFAIKPQAGLTLRKLSEMEVAEEAKERWEPTDPTSYNVRTAQYMKTRQKNSCEGAFYDVICADMFSFKEKQSHIAKDVTLPFDPYKRSDAEKAALQDFGIPPLLVINMQMPMYQASLFGNTDGEGHSLVYYCFLKEGFNPATFPNQAAVGMLQRLIQNGREHNSDATRSRLKIIPRVVNVDEFAELGPLSRAEKKLLTTYNEKPILTRPQHRFFNGKNYFELDFDLHSYAFIARKALGTMMHRIHHAVFENAFLIQGNRQEELPEYMLVSLRLHRIDFTKMRYFSDLSIESSKISQAYDGDSKDGKIDPN